MENTIDLSKYKSCENGAPIRCLKLAKSLKLNFTFIKGEVWHKQEARWCEAGWAKNGKLIGLDNGVFFDCNVKGYNLSVAEPTVKPEPTSKFKAMPNKTDTPKNLQPKEQNGQLNLFS